MILFPAIDLYEGQAVRLVKGDYNQKTVFKKICENNIFRKFIILGKSKGVGTVEKVV